jgi:dTMP kinase
MGLFITIEGIDGCGKSTQAKLLHNNLVTGGYSVVRTREPGGTPISEKIRDIILGTENSEMCDRCELLLYLAARAQHVEEKILPEMKKGNIVLSDRFEEATFAYQSFGRGLNFDKVYPINDFATGGLVPDLTIILDITIEESLRRFSVSGIKKDRIELCGPEFFTKVRGGYLNRYLSNPDRVYCISGEQPIEDIEKKIFSRVLTLMKDKNYIV